MTHAEKAEKLFRGGANCAQAVLTAFTDITGLTEEQSMKMASSFGGGMGRLREVCGACSAAFLAAGILYGYSDPHDAKAKADHYALIQSIAEDFRRTHGSIICRELLGGSADSSPAPTERTPGFYTIRPCVSYVRDAADILDRLIKSRA